MSNYAKLVVGIGASAGGLKALESFFVAVPPSSNCCFVVVQHLSPDFKSVLDELLGRYTSLPIHLVEHGMAAAANSVFVIPPKHHLKISRGIFELSDQGLASVAEHPIDVFFESLAADAGERAVGIVFSGCGSDGASGVRAIRSAGGLVLVQRPETAEFDGMPRNALAAGVAHFTLAPGEMPAVIESHAAGPAASPPLERIMAQLRRASGIDFSQYKIGTVERRVQRRADLQKSKDLAAYADQLAAQPDELDALYSDLLIGVTEFFRDAEVFDALREKVLPGLLAPTRTKDVRAWIAGCATGEEAYSLAILLDEAALATGFKGNFSIFATDVHRASLDFASAGVYESQRLENVSAERLARYFREEEHGRYRIAPEIRKRMVFAPHNLVSDQPFTRLDLISCRNLLIYFNATLQERAIRIFYFALREGGCLMLGPSEGVGRLEGVSFEPLDQRLKLFRRQGPVASPPPAFRAQPVPRPAGPPAPHSFVPRPGDALNRQLLVAYDHILRQHVPPGLLVNDAFEIFHYFGAASRYLQPLEGRVHESLLHRVDGDLGLCLSTLLPRVFKSGEPARSSNIRVTTPEGDERVDVVADPIPNHHAVAFVHLSFINARSVPPPLPADSDSGNSFVAGKELLQRIHDLEAELQATKENLQTAVEELQASNEELQSGNEELTAANEELQSANEELSAVNEELYTVNTEFERKNAELQVLNDDLNNLSNSTETGTVFVDRELRIRKFNPAIQRIFRMIPQDLGRQIDHIAYRLEGQEQMLQEVAWVLEHGEMRQSEVRTQDGGWLLRRVLPFVTAKGTVDGVVLTFTDITETKAMQDRLNLAMESSHLVWWEWDLPSDRLTVHCGESCILGYPPATLPGSSAAWEAAVHPDDLADLRTAIQPAREGIVEEWSCEHRFRRANGDWLWVFNRGKVIGRDAERRATRMIGTTQDISARRAAEETVHRDALLLSKIREAIICTDTNGVVTYWNDGATRLFGFAPEEIVGRPYSDRFPAGSDERQRSQERVRHVMAKGELQRELEDYRKDGSRVWTEARLVRQHDSQGNPIGLIALVHDITNRKREELKRQQLEAQLLQTQKMETMGTLAGGIAHDFNNIIGAIMGFTELAMFQNPQDESTRTLHENVLKASRRARDLVRRLLTFSRFHEPERKPVSLNQLVKESAELIRATLPATITLKLELEDADCPETLVDPNQLTQVLLNLAANASHAMRRRGGTLTLGLSRMDFTEAHPTVFGPLPPGTYLAIRISDTGHGIDGETLKKIFDPFFTTKPVGEGTGLGLSIVHGIIEGHGGGIVVASTVDVGTTFTLYLPVVAPLVTGGGERESKNPAIPPGHGEQIAVIDDEEDLARLAQATLQGLGYDASRFASAEDFFTVFSSMLFDVKLIVTDHTMPHMTGLELARKLRAAGHEQPILIVSGYSRDLTPRSLANLGRVELLKKPYERTQLAAAVDRLLRRSSAAGAP